MAFMNPRYLAGGPLGDAARNIVGTLVQGNPDGRLAELHPSILDYYVLESCIHSPDYAEALGCGPLSMAVLRDDIQEVARILARNPAASVEPDQGQDFSPFHLAANKPQVLSLFLEAVDPRSMDQSATNQMTVLEAAMRLSSTNCVHGSSAVKCRRGCKCVECIEMLFLAGHKARIQKEEFGGWLDLPWILNYASERARRLYVFHMRGLFHQRYQAKGQSQENTTYEKGILSTSKKHCKAGHDQKILEDWIFQHIYKVDHADLFFRHGFRPTPPFFCQQQYFRALGGLDYAVWLVEHGADPFVKLPTSQPGTGGPRDYGAYHLFYEFGKQLSSSLRSPDTLSAKMSIFEKVHATIIKQNLADDCICQCTERGCSPFIWMFQGLVSRRGFSHYSEKINSWAQKMELHSCLYYHWIPSNLRFTSIRWITFKVLDLAHTCCQSRDFYETDDNIEYESCLFDLHEELVKEFEAAATWFIASAPSGRVGFSLFWGAYWRWRMSEELSILEGDRLTNEERRAAESIGLRWCSPPPQTMDSNPYDYGTTEYVVYEMDQIYPEYDKPWPDWIQERLTHTKPAQRP
jgi:hypothetical protein